MEFCCGEYSNFLFHVLTTGCKDLSGKMPNIVSSQSFADCVQWTSLYWGTQEHLTAVRYINETQCVERDLAKDKQLLLFFHVITTPNADEAKKEIRQRIKTFSLKTKYTYTYLSENDLGNRFISCRICLECSCQNICMYFFICSSSFRIIPRNLVFFSYAFCFVCDLYILRKYKIYQIPGIRLGYSLVKNNC